jgi:hypothetical protein
MTTSMHDLIAMLQQASSKRYVYIMQRLDGAIKIGFSSDPVKRSYAIARSLKVNVEVLHQMDFANNAAAAEKTLHLHFASSRVDGEWFDISPAAAFKVMQVLHNDIGRATGAEDLSSLNDRDRYALHLSSRKNGVAWQKHEGSCCLLRGLGLVTREGGSAYISPHGRRFLRTVYAQNGRGP